MKTDLQRMTEIEMADKAARRVKDLGWANGWIETPEIVTVARSSFRKG